jgi:tyrosine-protein kinase
MDQEQQSSMREYLGVLRRGAWIVVVATLLAGAAAYFLAARETKAYSATAEVLVPPAPLNLVLPGGNSSSTVQQARDAATLAKLAETPAVAAGASAKLTPHVSADSLASMTSVTSDPSTNVITFTLRNHSRSFAVTAVNAYARSFADYENLQRVKAIDTAIASIKDQITQTKREAARAPKAQRFTFSQTLAKLASKQEAMSTARAVTASSPATLSKSASGAAQVAPKPTKDALLGLAAGLILGLGLASLRHLLDTRVRTADDVMRQINLPLLGRLSTPPRGLRSHNGLALLEQDDSALAEEYHKLRLSVDFANLPTRARSIVVTSSLAGEGKSTTIANLGVALAQAGRRVIIVDFDLRRPQMDSFFDLGGVPGMTDVLLGTAALEDALFAIKVGGVQPVARPDERGSLHVMASGPVPPNPVAFTESRAVGELIETLLQYADLLLLDSAPLLPVGDTIGLSRSVDAMIVLARADIVTRPALKDLHRTLQMCEAAKLGFIFTGAEAEPGYGYRNYASYARTAAPMPAESPQPPVRDGIRAD